MKRFLGFLCGGIIAAVIVSVFYVHLFPLPMPIERFLETIELQMVDYRVRFSPQPKVSEEIKIVLVNDVTNLIDKLAAFTNLVSTAANGQYKPKIIGFNYLFDGDAGDEGLVTAASIANNVYYGYNFLPPSEQISSQEVNKDILPFRLEITDIGNGIQPVLAAQAVRLPSKKYLATARGIGFVGQMADIDNVYRRIPLFLKYQNNWYGSLALSIVKEYMEIESIDIMFYPGQYFEIEDNGNFIKIPVNQDGEMLIDFAYTPEVGGLAPFETFSMEELLVKTAQIHEIPSQADVLAPLKDAIVLVGSQTDQELVMIPRAESYPLIGIHANVINNLLNNHFAREARLDVTIGIIVLFSMLTGLVISGRRLIAKIFLTLMIALLYVVIAYGLFFQFRLLLPILSPLLSIGLTLGVVSLVLRHKSGPKTTELQQLPVQEKRRKVSSDDLSSLEDELLEVRDELDRKSFRLRSKVEELRMLQEQGEQNNYDYSGQIAALQKEIRAREIELKSLVKEEEELRRQVENLPFTDANVAQFKQNTEKVRRLFAKRGVVTQNDNILYTLYRAEKLGKTSVTLLLQGEAGTGKNFLAKIIKEISSRHNRPMIEVICTGDMELLEDDLFGHKRGAFPGAEEHRNGYFRELDGGTIILEEVENLSLEIQTKLTQILRGKVVHPIGDDRGYLVDVRVIATTTQDLKALVSAGKFREDLYHYFSAFPLYLPPLRERKEDIPLLVNYLVHKYNRVHSKIVETVSEEALNMLLTYQWPGNIAELEKVIERAIAEVNPGVKELTEHDFNFEEADLGRGITDSGMLNYLIALMDPEKELPDYQQLRERVLVQIQRLYCARLLRLHNGNIKSAAIDTGLKEDTFKKMLSELMIDPENYRV